ncbi:hypothetical protein BKI51_07190 [Alphaproteobacteria bacterium AO1-B]|nr:hypothetical protein BKI51_07190 [Alphaproteobacteria bacterium AO1-B]
MKPGSRPKGPLPKGSLLKGSLPVTCDRSVASPYRAEGPLVFKTASRVQGYRARIRVPSYLMCAVNEGLEDPDRAARLIAEALNAHALLRATGTTQSKTAVRYWLEAYLASVSIPHTDPDLWLDQYREARERAAALLARHGLIALILETSRLLAENGPRHGHTPD